MLNVVNDFEIYGMLLELSRCLTHVHMYNIT